MPLTIIAITQNLSPLLICVMAYFLLKERVAKFEFSIMILSFVTIIVYVLTPASEESQKERAELPLPIWVFYILLAANPLLHSGGTIAMRKMKEFHQVVAVWYLNCLLAVVSFILILVLGNGWEIWKELDWISWVLLLTVALMVIMFNTFMFKALSLEKAGIL